MAQESERLIDIVDDDSALGSSESTYTETLRTSLRQSVLENGRAYHRYRDGQYLLPDDEREQDRQDMQHEMFLRTFNRKLLLAPIPDKVHHALDLGTGTGIWAIDFANEHPECSVIGTDLSPIQPTLTPPNCKFIIDDFEDEWAWSEKFDLVHGRVLTGAFQDGKRLIQQVYDALKPGGWLELQDILLPITSDDGTLRDTTFAYLQDLFFQAMEKIGRDPGDVDKYDQWMTQAGFDGVKKVSYKWPLNTWPKDKALKEIGAWNLINTIDGLEGYSIRPFTQILGMSLEKVQVLVAKSRQDLINRQIHAYTNVIVVYGQKLPNVA